MNLNKYEADICSHAKSRPDEEVCGVVILNRDLTVSIKRLSNESSDPKNCFFISPGKFIKLKTTSNIIGIYHSHPCSSEAPSAQDILVSEEIGLPYLIYSLKTESFFLYYPESYQPVSIIGRPYVKGFYECTCLLKDYFLMNLSINITKWNKNYWLPSCNEEANKLLKKIMSKNLIAQETKTIKTHDVIIFQIKERGRRHVGVYTGGDDFVHQCGNSISRTQTLDDKWQSRIKEIYRHPSLV